MICHVLCEVEGNSGVEKNQEVCIILKRKESAGVDENRVVFKTPSNDYDEAFF